MANNISHLSLQHLIQTHFLCSHNNIIIDHLIRLMLTFHSLIKIFSSLNSPKIKGIAYLEWMAIMDRQKVLLFLTSKARLNNILAKDYCFVGKNVVNW